VYRRPHCSPFSRPSLVGAATSSSERTRVTPFTGSTMAPSSPLPSLLALVRDAGSGDPKALEQFLTEVHPILLRYAVRVLGDGRDLPADIGQEALIRIAEGLHQVRAESDAQVIAWCLTIARHLCIDWIRRLRREPSYVGASTPEHTDQHVDDADSSPTMTLQYVFDLLRFCEAELPTETRTILYLRLVEGASWADTAHELGLPVTAAKRRFQRAQQSLVRRMLKRADALPDPIRQSVLDRIRDLGVPD